MMIINLVGIALILLIVWWFWLYQPEKTVLTSAEIVIEVKDGVYLPASIEVAAGQPFTLQFNRQDPSPCSQTLLLPALGISETLTLNELTKIQIPALAQGEYQFHCQMQMYRGVITAV